MFRQHPIVAALRDVVAASNGNALLIIEVALDQAVVNLGITKSVTKATQNAVYSKQQMVSLTECLICLTLRCVVLLLSSCLQVVAAIWLLNK